MAVCQEGGTLIYKLRLILVSGYGLAPFAHETFSGLQSTPLNPRVDPLSGSTIHSTRLVG